ncbi:MAG: DUF3168 domain-containing protein [Alphaproteobacteria bacterium]|jgi:hypothetical protein|nr:DUF3168 domain-containing protein [Alphaproteobacteria bacterium]MBU2040539.1 DUF3168 domain-containing protein [Alphaproteobacteria bacterium]MBU2126591.1 DUF3168 domain-containing protein [Alphaproteobacteria bacterium]MBU2207376.1 DUF3168 domain-containing protein [Alphaproteobacteria bacterium]MBU2396269.1 DUF3168 domain-containing protein [Alphaproteobacteria bacterium]
MSAHELALQKALIAHLKADAGVQALLGEPARIRDSAPADTAFPHLLIGRCESRPVAADGGGLEQALTLTVVSRFRGTEEAKAILAAVRVALNDAALEADGVRTVSLRVPFADVFPAADGARTFAVLRVRAVTEEVET